jgi:hypothetical protein
MEHPVAEMAVGADSIVGVRVRLVDCEPRIWRLPELDGSVSLGQAHEVLQVAFGWEDVHLHRFTASDPFARLRPVDGEIPEALQWAPCTVVRRTYRHGRGGLFAGPASRRRIGCGVL